VLLVGSPNVGKSLIFYHLTSTYATVSNYPGTTVEITRAPSASGDLEVVDTPGLYSLLPAGEDEHVTRRLLLTARPAAVIHVVSALHLERMLSLTLQLCEAGLPVILVVNMLDEAARRGLTLDLRGLERRLGVPVCGTVAARGLGIAELRRVLAEYVRRGTAGGGRGAVDYGGWFGPVLQRLEGLLTAAYPLSPRSLALLLCQGDREAWDLVRRREGAGAAAVRRLLGDLTRDAPESPACAIAEARGRLARCIARAVACPGEGVSGGASGAARLLDRLLVHPLLGLLPVLIFLYVGLYLIVGRLGAGTVVDLLDGALFGRLIGPLTILACRRLSLPAALVDLVAGEYGLVTLGLRYAVAVVLPVVGLFFFVFALVEDSGYLPRLALLVDRATARLGLNGRAVIPLTLGLGCGTMAVVVCRTLETRRERLLAATLLAVAVPCSAQLGLILALLSGRPAALLFWAGTILAVFLLLGRAADRLLPGARSGFILELPPLRLPSLGNVWQKTRARVTCYAREILPLFLGASVVIWLGRLTGLLEAATRRLEPAVGALGLPPQLAVVFLFGFFRRDYGAAGLYDLARHLDATQLVVAATTLTLFVPCVAQLAVMIRELGLGAALAITVLACCLAWGTGWTIGWLAGCWPPVWPVGWW